MRLWVQFLPKTSLPIIIEKVEMDSQNLQYYKNKFNASWTPAKREFPTRFLLLLHQLFACCINISAYMFLTTLRMEFYFM